MTGFFVTGIGTDVGKTLVCAILCEALHADYWKPLQAGNLGFTDSDVVRSLLSNPVSRVHSELYRLNEPLSPHAAAKIDGVAIDIAKFECPRTERTLIVEGAGGLLVPLSRGVTIRNVIEKLQLPVILVSRNYLGSINHTLLTIEALKSKNIPIHGIIFNGEANAESEHYILESSEVRLLGRIGIEEMIDQAAVRRNAEQLRKSLV